MGLSTEVLRTFVCVSEEKSFSNAAHKLHKSQSSVSTQIKLLEEQLGSKLFHRSAHPPELTEAGRTVYRYAKEILDRTRDLKRDLEAFSSGVSGEVRVGAISSINTYLLLPTVGQLLRQYPHLKISIVTQSRLMLFESVRQAAIDFAIVLSDKQPENLSVKVLMRERLLFVASAKLRMPRHFSLDDLPAISFVMGLNGSEYGQMVTRLLEKTGVKNIAIAMRMSNWEGIKEAVRAGIGIAILPHFIVERELRDHSIREILVKNVRLEANIMLLEKPNRKPSNPATALVKDALVSGIMR
jgi:DNA-binding transcriptional LysR family regulator